MPSASALRPSSAPEQSMPWLSAPWMVETPIWRPPGSTAPGKATGTRWPTAMFVAPQTIDSGASDSDTFTLVSCSRSALGCGADLEQLPDHDRAPVRADTLDRLDLHAERRQALGQTLRRQVEVDVIAQPGQAGRASELASRKRMSLSRKARMSGMPWRSIAIRSMPMPKAKPWYRSGSSPPLRRTDGVDHARAKDGQPARPLAGGAADAAADRAADVERHRRLGERVVAGSEAGALVRAEHRVGELVEQPAQVGHRRALVDHQAFDLEELEAVAGVDLLVADSSGRAGRHGSAAADSRIRRIWPGEVWVRSRWRAVRSRRHRACPTGRAPGDLRGC